MGTVFQIISVILIIGAVFLFWAKISNETMITKGQRAWRADLIHDRYFALHKIRVLCNYYLYIIYCLYRLYHI